MMDDDMNMDDLHDELFGDQAGLSLMEGQSLPSRPPTKELRQRIDDLRGSGCCQCVRFRFFDLFLAYESSPNPKYVSSADQI